MECWSVVLPHWSVPFHNHNAGPGPGDAAMPRGMNVFKISGQRQKCLEPDFCLGRATKTGCAITRRKRSNMHLQRGMSIAADVERWAGQFATGYIAINQTLKCFTDTTRISVRERIVPMLKRIHPIPDISTITERIFQNCGSPISAIINDHEFHRVAQKMLKPITSNVATFVCFILDVMVWNFNMRFIENKNLIFPRCNG